MKGFPNIDDNLKNHFEKDPKIQKCAQQKFRMILLLVLQNLFA